MAIEKVISYFEERGMADRIRRFSVSSATVDLAAAALGVEGARIAKTMSFLSGDRAILVVAAGDVRVDNGKFKAQFHTKAKMVPPDLLEGLVGHAMGGVCPFAVNPACDVYLDISLRRFAVVYPAAGDAASAAELTIPELESLSGYKAWVDVCKSPET
jgi:prolyl-tRNA editing enzyme YbaK/EbsC (Cys-tRNA(Pro) deacylase)